MLKIFKKSFFYIFLGSSITLACKNSEVRVVSRYPNGAVKRQLEYPDKRDRSNYLLKIFFPDGKIKKQAKVEANRFVGRILTFFENGKVFQIDSLSAPCDTAGNACSGALIRYYQNGSISQRFTVTYGHLNGMCEHYSANGVLVKKYFLKDDSVKDGKYEEFYPSGQVELAAEYKNDTIFGFEYFFKENGDTIKYFFHSDGQIDFPYKKWLNNGNIVYGVHAKGDQVLWTWYNKDRKEIKSKLVDPRSGGYKAPDE